MSEVDKYESYKRKLENLCDEHDLVYRFRHGEYPITLTIMPNRGVGEQLSLLAEADERSYISPDAALIFYREDGELQHKIVGTFSISEALFGKFRNLYKNLHDCWLQYFYRDLIENRRVSKTAMPVIDESEAEDEDSAEDEDELPEGESSSDEDLIQAATLLLRQENKASVALLQRRLKLGYSRAARLMDELEERGVVGPYNGSTPRVVLAADVPEE